jgi:AAA family ATP:ADP antiporter
VIRLLESTLSIKREELAPAVLLFLYLFFAIGCYIIGQSVGDALFLSAFPNYLPHGIIATAVVVGIVTSIYIRLSHRLRLETLVTGSLLTFAAVFALFWLLTRTGKEWVYPLLYVWVYTVGALAPTMGWTLANHSLTTREARRVFGFVGAGGILGAPCAGFLTAALTRQAHLKPEVLLLVIAAGLSCCALWVRLLFRSRRERMAETDWNVTSAPASDRPKTLLQVWSVIRASRYLLLITALITIGCCATTVVGYQFKLIARQAYQGDKAGLAAFFGTFNGYIGIASFFLQMLLTGRLLSSLGIRVTIFIMPVIFLGGSLGVLLSPILTSAALLRGSQGLLRYSVDKSTTELLYLPITPPSVKNQVKSFIDGFVWRMADGIGGLALLMFASPLSFGPGRMSLLNFTFLGLWIATAYGVRKEYLTVLRSAIEHRKLDPATTATGVLDATTTELLAQSLQHTGEQQALYGLTLFELGREPAWHPALRTLLQHPSAEVRKQALHLLGETRQHGMDRQVEAMLGDESLEVRAEALHYLVHHEHKDPVLLLQTVRDVPAPCLQSAVAMHLANAGVPEWTGAADHILQGMIAEYGAEGAIWRREAARALGKITAALPVHSELLNLATDSNDAVVEQALLSAGRIQFAEAIPTVVQTLGQPHRSGTARAALALYGDEAVPALRDCLNNPEAPFEVRKAIPKALARIATADAARALGMSLVQSNTEIRYEVIKGLNRLRSWHPDRMSTPAEIARMIDFELLAYFRALQIVAALNGTNHGRASRSTHRRLIVHAVHERMAQDFERVFRLLSLIYPSADIYNAYLSLMSGRPQAQANALEMLEHLLPAELYGRVAGAADPERSFEQKLQLAHRVCQAGVQSEMEALRALLHSGDAWLCACALHDIGAAGLTDLQAAVSDLGRGEWAVDHTWLWTNARLQTQDKQHQDHGNGADMLSLLEKVDLLRASALFASVPTQSLARLAAIASEVNWTPRQIAYHEQSPAEELFFLIEGEIEIVRGGTIVGKIGPLQVPGGLAALSLGSHSETAVASQPTRALRLDREEFFEAMAEDARVAQGIVKALAGMANGAA